MDYLAAEENYSALSIRDLVKARDEFHIHLMHKANVIGTAIGRYRVRKGDAWPNGRQHSSHGGSAEPRTLQNSEVRPYSWPAILVFVDSWLQDADFRGTVRPEEYIPPAVYMADGRKAPICVILATKEAMRHPWDANYTFPKNFIGGGFPILTEAQGEQRVASIGCVVTDGHGVYALTNRHVVGDAHEPVYSVLHGNKARVGVAAGRSLTRASFSSIYQDWPAKNVFVDLDAALIQIDDIHQWTTQVYGMGRIGKLADLSAEDLSLRLIGCPVKAFGAASRSMHGEVAALFYRFKAVGGFEYVSDFLIGPKEHNDSLGTHPGDSGTVWLLDFVDGSPPMPLALQWGGQVFLDGQSASGSSYALATALSTICNLLNVDVVRDWNADQPDFWGAVGHYGIATMAIEHLPAGKLKALMTANLDRISFDIADVTKKKTSGLSTHDFVPLADVPDLVWKVGPHKRGGPTSPEHANHFADMDRQLANPLAEGATLLEICKNLDNVSVDVWQRYYDAVEAEHPGENRGLLPFRCWQIFDAMRYYVEKGDVKSFVAAAGILSHYVGDACQPLHISYLFNGDPDRPKQAQVKDPKTKQLVDVQVPYGKGVHSSYEDDMIDNHVGPLWQGVSKALEGIVQGKSPADGKGAAQTVVHLMQQTFATIAPMAVVDAYAGQEGQPPKAKAEALWNAFGADTITVMAGGAACLARLWEGAWKAGGGDAAIDDLTAIPEADLAAIYQPSSFLVSKTLDTIQPILATGTGGAENQPVQARRLDPGTRHPAARG